MCKNRGCTNNISNFSKGILWPLTSPPFFCCGTRHQTHLTTTLNASQSCQSNRGSLWRWNISYFSTNTTVWKHTNTLLNTSFTVSRSARMTEILLMHVSRSPLVDVSGQQIRPAVIWAAEHRWDDGMSADSYYRLNIKRLSNSGRRTQTE